MVIIRSLLLIGKGRRDILEIIFKDNSSLPFDVDQLLAYPKYQRSNLRWWDPTTALEDSNGNNSKYFSHKKKTKRHPRDYLQG
jgi:hypothetical protein